LGGTVFENVQEVPALLTIRPKGADGCIDGVLRQKAVGPLMVEDGVAAGKFRQCLADPILELLDAYTEQGRRSLVKPPGPLAVVHASHIEVLLENALLDRSQDFSALLWT